MNFLAALAAADLPIRRCLELAYDALRAGGLACGSVLVDAHGEIVAAQYLEIGAATGDEFPHTRAITDGFLDADDARDFR